MIKIEKLKKTYIHNGQQLHALKNINIDVKKSEIFGVIGRSGAGKSTLIRCINLLEKPDSGSVIIDGIDLTQLSAAKLRQTRRKIAMIFQHFNLLNSRTVFANVALPLELIGMSKKQIAKKVLPLLKLTGLEDKQQYYPSELSGGQKQRVAIARALASDPKVLLCDEATSALDPETTESILQLLKDINNKLNLTIVLITHEMEVIKNLCDRVGIIEDGELVEQGGVIQIFNTPKTEVAKNFVNASIKRNLPQSLSEGLSQESAPGKALVVRIVFQGENTEAPLVTKLIREFNLDLNILQANVEMVQDQLMGIMLTEIVGEPEQISAGLAYLKEQDQIVEEVGYV